MTISTAPTLTNVVTGSTKLTLYFSPPTDNGGQSITGYKYTLNNGVTFINASVKASPIIITGLTNGTLYQVALKAVNSSGDSPQSNTILATPATLPSAPSITSLVPGDSQLTVNFNSGSNGGTEITNYKYSIDGGTNYMLADTANSPIIITGLTNGNKYTVKLKAITVVGESVAATSPIIRLPTKPSSPTIKSIVGGNRKLMVTFTSPNDNGGLPIAYYKYSVNNGPFVQWTGKLGIALVNPITIDGLDNGIAYSIKLKAVNAFGESEESIAVSGTPYTYPAAPTINTVQDVNNQTVISWQGPANNGGSSIKNYKYSINGGVTWTNISAPAAVGGSGTITIPYSGLQRIIVLKAVNAAGDSESSNINFHPVLQAPAQPTITKLTDTASSIAVAFNPPSFIGGAPITGYKYCIQTATLVKTQASEFEWTWRLNWDGNLNYTNVNQIKSPLVITKSGDVLNHPYKIQLKACNAYGDSNETSPVYSPSFSVPGAPVLKLLNYDSNSSYLQATFLDSINDGGTQIEYYSYCLQTATTGGWTTETWHSINLQAVQLTSGGRKYFYIPASAWTPSRVHRIRVKAVNAVGSSVESNALIVSF